MTEIQKLQQEIDNLNLKRNEVIKANSVNCNAPKSKRSYTHRTSPAIKPSDVIV